MILITLAATSLIVAATPVPVQSGSGQAAQSSSASRSTPFPGMPLRCLTPDRERQIIGGTSQPMSDCSASSTTILPLYEPGELWCIPVVVHVLRHNNGVTGNVPMARVESQIDILNEDFQALAGSLGAPGNNATIQFFLADTMPDGTPTNGVTYSDNTTWYNDSGSYWNSLAWDPTRYLNIYTNQASGALGYVPYLPQTGPEGSASDRVVILHSAFGRNAPIGPPYNKGRTATHEVGHYLGLFHTFDGGCGGGGCSSSGDLLCDTERESGPEYNCPSSSSSCSSPDPVHNYMDYSTDICMYEFTPDQVNRMRCTLLNYRPNTYEVCGSGSTEVGSKYCLNTPNSTGSPAEIFGSGSDSITANDLVLHGSPVPPSTNGLFFYGSNQIQALFGNGYLCAGGTIYRLPVMSSGPLGAFDLPFDAMSSPGISVLTTWNFQAWYRDTAAGGALFNTSDGLTVTFIP